MLNYKSYASLTDAVNILAAKLPGPYSCVIGVPRSGMIPAFMLALRWNIPCYSLPEYINEITHNAVKRRVMNKPEGIPLLVDDSVLEGRSLGDAVASLATRTNMFHTAALYVTAEASHLPNYYAEIVPCPRVFEWNLFHHDPFLQFCGLDIDGVLCPDQPHDISETKDEAGYIDWITNAPCIRPSSVLVGAFVTSRLEKYRPQTEEWLARQGYDYCKLIMSTAPDAETRRALHMHAVDKANAYKEHPHWKLFIESSYWQAKIIFEKTGRPVLCTDEGRLFQ